MLHKLTIRNYAIIEELEVTFSESMNIITGETGAGKSILLGALSLILGDRADTKVLYDKDEKCVIEAHFEIENKGLKGFFENHELDFEVHTIVRREINQSGKSRAFVNDTPVNLNVLKELGEKLVNVHSQHETLDLVKSGFQLQVVDSIAGNKALLDDYKIKYGLFKRDAVKYEVLKKQWQSSSAEMDYLQFQLKELAEAKLQSGEQEVLEAEQNTLGNVEEIKRALQNAGQLLSNGEVSALDQLNEIQGLLKPVKNFNPEILALTQRIQTTIEELKDIATEFETLQESTSLDPEKLEEVTGRLNAIYKLEKKHAAKNVDDLLLIQNSLEDRIGSVDSNSQELENLKKEMERQWMELQAMAQKLHSAREKVLRDFQTHVIVLLAKVGMPYASFKVDIKQLPNGNLNDSGFTEMKFLLSANRGVAPEEIKDIASGGELSRLMLCIKSLVADADDLPTLVFDEIDAGISGEVALKVSEIMKKLSRNHQLICVTHLPQIARTGDKHFYVYKENRENRTQTRLKELKPEERVVEIAKMLSGDKISEASLANAREMIAA